VTSINIENLLNKIKEETGCKFDVYPGIKGDITIPIPSESLEAIVRVFLKDFDYCHLSAITAQKREDKNDKIEVFYNFWLGQSLSLRVELTERQMILASIISLIPGADFYEREAAEMFGIEFTGRVETPHLLLPDDWDQGPPFISGEVKNG
jgi:NADH:ubiquinone oxidoreductase subunit C